MTTHVAIVGSGKMARSIGHYLINGGAGVTFVSSNAESMELCQRKTIKDVQRSPDTILFPPRFMHPDTIRNERPFDIIIEATREDWVYKQQSIDAIKTHIADHSLILSTSSSLLPAQIHPRCIGVHFFYPVFLNTLVECIIPDTTPIGTIHALISFFKRFKLNVLYQTEKTAFCANRLLLPLQAEAIRLILCGIPPSQIDTDSCNDLLPVGQISLLNTIGIELLTMTIPSYRGRMSATTSRDYQTLFDACEYLLPHLGTKNPQTLLLFDTLYASGISPASTMVPPSLPDHFLYLLVNTILQAIARKEITPQETDQLFTCVWGADSSFTQVAATIDPQRLNTYLTHCHHLCNCHYFEAQTGMVP